MKGRPIKHLNVGDYTCPKCAKTEVAQHPMRNLCRDCFRAWKRVEQQKWLMWRAMKSGWCHDTAQKYLGMKL
jgi:hypothetical protein